MSAPIPESRPMSGLSLWSHLEFIVVVSNPNLQRQIACRDLSAVDGLVEVKKKGPPARRGQAAPTNMSLKPVTEESKSCSNKNGTSF